MILLVCSFIATQSAKIWAEAVVIDSIFWNSSDKKAAVNMLKQQI